jgi:glyoxylase-like metal-dependent hydrolase (beta-lactamase superfamily II)
MPTPGHTPGHVADLRRRDKVLLAGDAVPTVNLNSVGGVLLGRQRVAGPPWYTTWDWPAAKRSTRALAGLEPRVLLPGHGRSRSVGTAAALHALALDRPRLTAGDGAAGLAAPLQRQAPVPTPATVVRPAAVAGIALTWLAQPQVCRHPGSPRTAVGEDTADQPGAAGA